jgi:hypothetical protein
VTECVVVVVVVVDLDADGDVEVAATVDDQLTVVLVVTSGSRTSGD